MPNLFIQRGSGVIKVIIINNSNGSGVPPGGAVGSEGWGGSPQLAVPRGSQWDCFAIVLRSFSVYLAGELLACSRYTEPIYSGLLTPLPPSRTGTPHLQEGPAPSFPAVSGVSPALRTCWRHPSNKGWACPPP